MSVVNVSFKQMGFKILVTWEVVTISPVYDFPFVVFVALYLFAIGKL